LAGLVVANIILTIHLILALCLIGIVLMQRSEGGGLGMGGGGGVVTGRQAASALGRLTWGFAIAFIATSITLTILAARDAATSSVIDSLGVPLESPAGSPAPGLPLGDLLPPPAPAAGGPAPVTAPLTPPRAD
jgi:preprotein translocase subunit SecG